MAHLELLCVKIKRTVPIIEKAHFLTDGPTTQYRNKSMFYIFGKEISRLLQAEEMTWNFCESGRGKGAPDDVGGLIKRTADRLVATGVDIPNFKIILTLMEAHCPNIKIVEVDDIAIEKWNVVPDNVQTFIGTMKIHQLTWSVEHKHTINARRLSCTTCSVSSQCTHFHIGQISIETDRLRFSNVYSDSDEADDTSANKVGDYIIAEWPKQSKVCITT